MKALRHVNPFYIFPAGLVGLGYIVIYLLPMYFRVTYLFNVGPNAQDHWTTNLISFSYLILLVKKKHRCSSIS
jgi:hypothetical protein